MHIQQKWRVDSNNKREKIHQRIKVRSIQIAFELLWRILTNVFRFADITCQSKHQFLRIRGHCNYSLTRERFEGDRDSQTPFTENTTKPLSLNYCKNIRKFLNALYSYVCQWLYFSRMFVNLCTSVAFSKEIIIEVRDNTHRSNFRFQQQ